MADKSFGVKELNLLNASGTPTVTSPNNLNLNANTVAISTSATVGNNLTVTSTTTSANVNVTGIATVVNFNATGISTIAQPSNTNAHSAWLVTANGTSAYRFTGPGQDGSDDDPDVYLVRGQRYIFTNNSGGSHPFQIRVASGGAAYSTGVTNNGASSGNIIFNVQHDAPAQLFYQCTSHSGMVGNIYIVGGPQVVSGVITATSFSGNLSGGTVSGTTGTFSGNVDIGGGTHSRNLTVHAATNSVILIEGASNGTSNLMFGDENDEDVGMLGYNHGSNYLAFTVNAAERLRINSSGEVNIGGNYTQTQSPLCVTTSANDYGIRLMTGSNKVLDVLNNGTAGECEIRGYYNNNTGTQGEGFRIEANGTTFFDPGGTTGLRIDSSGRLLLGATSYGGGGATPVLYVVGTSGRQVKIHNTNSATTSLQLTNAATGQGEDQGMQLAALSNGECGIFNAEAERILIQSQEADNNKPVVNFIKPQGPSNAQAVMIAFESGNQGRGAIKCSSSDGGLPSLVALSDYRIKTNIRDYTSGYDTIKAIPVKLFDMTSDGTKDIKGWIAHEVQDYIPEAVLGDKDAVDSNGNPILQNLGYGSFMPDVVGALQTAIAKIETLEAKVAALEGS